MTALPLLALALGARLLAAPLPDEQPGPVRLDATRFDSVTAVALRSLLDSAAARGLPVAPLVNRAYEGAARRVGGARLLAVVRSHAEALADARDALGEQATVAELDAGATALRAGLEARALRSIRAARPPGEAVTALVVLTDLVRRGIPASAARDAVGELVRLPAADDALLGLQGAVARGATRSPTMAADALQRYIRATVPAPRAPAPGGPVERSPTRPPPP